ncbi:MAG: glycosyltransferase [Bacteroidota bacterium]
MDYFTMDDSTVDHSSIPLFPLQLYICAMKRVLVIAYYWPPAGGGGVQRWVKFCKYLPDFDWEPIVYTPEDADYPTLDTSLVEDVSPSLKVLRQPIWEPRKLYAKWVNSSAGKGPQTQTDEVFYLSPKERSWKQNVSLWIRGNLVIPDARKFWIKPSIKFLSTYLEKNPVDAIISTGPPHSMHLIALGLKQKLGIPWIADFRDPWTHIEFYDKLMLSSWADSRHKYLEKRVHQVADAVIKVSPAWIDLDAPLEPQRSRVITNGYDEADFNHTKPTLREEFVISHIGTLAPDRNPKFLWEVLKDLCKENTRFAESLKLQFVGKTDPFVIEKVEKMGLGPRMEDLGYVSHQSSIELMQSTQVLLLLINESEKNAVGRIPGKVFEYLAAQRPILVIGPPTGDAAKLIQDLGAGSCVNFEDKFALRREVDRLYTLFTEDNLHISSAGIKQYSRKKLTNKLVELLEEVVGSR